MTTDGTIRAKYWSVQRYAADVQKWTAQADVTVTDDTVE